MTVVSIPRVNLARLAAGPVALAVGLGALAVAQGPGRFTTYAGGSGLIATLTVAAGLALVVAGLVTSFSTRRRALATWPSSPASSGSRPSGSAGTGDRRWSGAWACSPPASPSRCCCT